MPVQLLSLPEDIQTSHNVKLIRRFAICDCKLSVLDVNTSAAEGLERGGGLRGRATAKAEGALLASS